MSDPKDVWPPPPLSSPPASPLKTPKVSSGKIALSCFGVCTFLMAVWLFISALGEHFTELVTGKEGLGYLGVAIAGIAFAVHGWRSWQGKVALLGLLPLTALFIHSGM